ncbi:unnamed protein product [Aphanomyces euteiches]
MARDSTFNRSVVVLPNPMPRKRILPRHLWVSKKERLACLCGKPFTFFRHRHHCRLCGDIFCRECIVECRAIDMAVKVCQLCTSSLDAAAHMHRRRKTIDAAPIKLLETARCIEYRRANGTFTRQLPASAPTTPSEPLDPRILQLLRDTHLTQSTIAEQNANATVVLNAHSDQLTRLHQAISRIEAQLSIE